MQLYMLAIIGVPIASNNAVKLVKTQAVNFAWQIVISFEKLWTNSTPSAPIGKSLVCPKKYPINLKVCAKIVGTMNKVSLRTADVFPVVAGGEATTGNTSAVRRLE